MLEYHLPIVICMHKGFWQTLKYPILGMSPMDGVTDVVFRSMMAKHSPSDLMITEFVSVEGMNVGNPEKVFTPFLYEKDVHPIVAQVFGSTPDAFYQSAIMVAHMGFDGIDINMGCPAKNISARGAGAGLIRTPELAQAIIRAVQQGVVDYEQGKGIDDLKIPQRTKDYLWQHYPSPAEKRPLLPVSVKTRIGYDEIVIEKWVETLLECTPVNISIHGRTLEQMYSGKADWDAIGRAVKIIHQTETSVLGNGDIQDLADAQQKIEQYKVDGVLIGRACFGNPWIFRGHVPTIEERLNAAVEHAKLYESWFGTEFFHPMRKHLSWYIHGFSNAKDLRLALIKTNSASEVVTIVDQYLNQVEK